MIDISDEWVGRLEALAGPRANDRTRWRETISARLTEELGLASSRLVAGFDLRHGIAEALLSGALPTPPTAASERVEFYGNVVLGHRAAIAYLIEHCETLLSDPYKFKQLHALLIGLEPSAPSDVQFCDVEGEKELETLLKCTSSLADPWAASILLWAHIVKFPLFQFGNQRLGRLAANIPLLSEGLRPITFFGTRSDFYTEAVNQWLYEGDQLVFPEYYAKTYSAEGSMDSACDPIHAMAPAICENRPVAL